MKLQARREAQGLTQEALGAKLNVTRSAVAMWETGKAKPTTDKLIALANVLSCTVDDLLSES